MRELLEGIQLHMKISNCEELVFLLPPNLNESKFINKFPFDVRIDPPHGSHGMRHAHIKRIDDPGKQISYNIDGTRHDAHKFCNNFPGLKNAQAFIRKEFNLPKDFMFEVIGIIDETCLLLELKE